MELQKQRHGVTMPNGFILPEGKTTPNTLFVGGIDMKVEEDEIREFFGRFGAVKEVKIITYRGGICKGMERSINSLSELIQVEACDILAAHSYGFVYFSEDVDIQTIIEQQITFKGKKLKLGPAIMKERISRGFPDSVQSPLIGPSQWVSPSPCVYCPCCPPSLALSGGTQYVQPYPYATFPGVMMPQMPMNYTQTVYPYQNYVDCGVQTLLTLL